MRFPHLFLTLLTLISLFPGMQVAPPAQENSPHRLFIPVISRPPKLTAHEEPIVNIPYIPADDITRTHLGEMAVFWMGALTPTRASTDVRIAYNDRELVIYTATFDRIISYNPASRGDDLPEWDTSAISIQTNAGHVYQLNEGTYRFMSEVRWFEPANDPRYDAAFVGRGSSWQRQSLPFNSKTGYMANATTLTDELEDKGWAVEFRIPFSTLGMDRIPQPGTEWRLQVQVHNRNSPSGPSLGPETWPRGSNGETPATWGWMRFGIPGWEAPGVRNVQTVSVRYDPDSPLRVFDAAAGGGADCGGSVSDQRYYDFWGALNYAGKADFNIQNQGLIADWNCFSRYALTMDLPRLPQGKVFRSARLVMSQMGGSDPSTAVPSWIQVFTLGEDWSEATLNWNNFPQAHENISGTWVDVYAPPNPMNWTTIPKWEWDVSQAVAEAYAQGKPMRIAMYAADHGSPGGMHSGKYFVSSDTEEWNENNRPVLLIDYGDP